MDKTAQNNASSGQTQPQDDQQYTASVSDPKQSQNNQLPTSSVSTSTPEMPGGSVHKERGPVIRPEIIKPSNPEVVLHEAVEKSGVEKSPNEELQLTEEQKRIGIELAKESTPISSQPTLVKLPITEEKAEAVQKSKKSVKDSLTWLALLVIRQLKIARSKKKEEEK